MSILVIIVRRYRPCWSKEMWHIVPLDSLDIDLLLNIMTGHVGPTFMLSALVQLCNYQCTRGIVECDNPNSVYISTVFMSPRQI